MNKKYLSSPAPHLSEVKRVIVIFKQPDCFWSPLVIEYYHGIINLYIFCEGSVAESRSDQPIKTLRACYGRSSVAADMILYLAVASHAYVDMHS